MRTLIVGSNRGINASLAVHKVGESNVHWEVISSYQASCSEWKTLPNVDKVTCYQDLKDNEPDETKGLVLEVVASSFFEKTWVKSRLSSEVNLVVITNAPVSYLDKSLFPTFHNVFITRTNSSEKQGQYHALFVNVKKHHFPDFKKSVKSLTDFQYLSVAPDGTLEKMGWTGMASSAPEPPVSSHPGNIVPKAVRVTNTSEEQKHAPVVPQPNIKPQVLSSRKAPPEPVPSDLKRPKNVEVKENVSELWLNFSVKPSESGENTLDKAVTAVETMLSTDMLISMFTCAYHEKHPDTNSGTFYFQVFERRQDLFVALVVNMLQSLRVNHVIQHGSLSI